MVVIKKRLSRTSVLYCFHHLKTKYIFNHFIFTSWRLFYSISLSLLPCEYYNSFKIFRFVHYFFRYLRMGVYRIIKKNLIHNSFLFVIRKTYISFSIYSLCLQVVPLIPLPLLTVEFFLSSATCKRCWGFLTIHKCGGGNIRKSHFILFFAFMLCYRW